MTRNEKQPLSFPSRPALFTFLLIVLLTFLAINQLLPPAALPDTAPPTEFSSARAIEDLKVIAQKPHPTGSQENSKVRDYIVQRLRAMGLDAQIQTTTVTRHESKWRGPAMAATVNNIVARLKGTANGRTVMLAAHYDSVPTGPGASDDGSGTATLLETLRALKAGPPLKNDVIFLFSDGEELGLLGAKAFVDEHPWARDAAVALNFEARGACGPSVMFETSPQNGWVIREFAKAARHPVASSSMYEAYKRLPNGSDMTIFERAGMAGLNFAYAGCWPRYHTLRDDIANMDPRSLQHDGSYAVSLARHFADLNLNNPKGEDAVYFSLFGEILHYSEAWVVPLMVVALLLFVGVVALGLRRRQLTWPGMILGSLGWLAGTIIAAAVSELAWLALKKMRLVSLLPYGNGYNCDLYLLGFIALTITTLSVLYAVLQKKTSVASFTVGTLAWWASLTVVTSLYTPGASFLFAWPLLSSLVELGYAFAGKNPEAETQSFLVWTLPAMVGILLFAPLPYELLMLVSTSGLILNTVAVGLLVGFLAPQVHIMTAHRSWLLPGAALVAALGLITAAMAKNGYDSNHPRADSIFYALNADTGKATWASIDQAPDEWTSQFLSGDIKKGNLDALMPAQTPAMGSQAPAVPLDAPRLAPLEDLTIGAERTLGLWLSSPRRAHVAWVVVRDAKVLGAKVNGKTIDPGEANRPWGNWGFFYVGLPERGIVLDLTVKASEPLTIKVGDQADGLPELPGTSFRPRPASFMPSPTARFDSSTVVTKTFHFKASP